MSEDPREKTRRMYREAVYITTFFQSELSKAMQQVSEEVGLNGTAKFSQYFILCELYIRGKSTLTELSEAVGVTLPNVSTAVNEMYELGIVERIDDPVDRRKVNIHITPKGMEFSEKLLPYCSKVSRVLYGGPDQKSNEESDRLLEGFDRILERIKDYRSLNA